MLGDFVQTMCMEDVLYDWRFASNNQFNKPNQTDMQKSRRSLSGFWGGGGGNQTSCVSTGSRVTDEQIFLLPQVINKVQTKKVLGFSMVAALMWRRGYLLAPHQGCLLPSMISSVGPELLSLLHSDNTLILSLFHIRL